jgi:hypothetical protein
MAGLETGTRAGARRRVEAADAVICACLVAYGLAVWWPTRGLPYYWDTATFVIDAARDLRASGFHPLVATHSDFAHPPLLVAMVALAWSLFGESRVVAHAVMLPALPAMLVATYWLGVRLADRAGREVGGAAALLAGGAAVVVAEAGQVYMDLPLGALAAWGLLAWVSGRRGWAAALLSAAALVKFPAPLTVPAALAIAHALRPETRRDVRGYALLAIPVLVTLAWLAYHAAVTGWWLWRPGRELAAPRSWGDRAFALAMVTRWLLLDGWRWVLALGAAAAAVALRLRRAPLDPAVAGAVRMLALQVGAGIVLFAAVGEFGLRYGIYLLPPYVVACLLVVRAALPAQRRGGAWLAMGAAALFAAFASTWHPRRERTAAYDFRPDEDLGYVDMVTVGRRASRWLEAHHADAEIYGAGPEGYELREPWQGYVTRPLAFSWCVDFDRHPGVEQLVIVHGYHPQQPLCRRVVDALAAQPLARFEENGKWLEVYRVPAS